MAPTQSLKESFVAGAALLAPLVVTLVALQLIFSWLRGIIDPVVSGARLGEYAGDVPYLAELLALGLIALAIAVLGYFAQRTLGGILFGLVDRALGSIPGVSVIYTSVRQVSDALMNRETRYESAALVEYPRKGVYSIGFVTAEGPGEVSEATDEDISNVYVPNSPNPTQGRFLFVPDEELIELDMSVRRAIRLLVTTGIAEDEGDYETFTQGEVSLPEDLGDLSPVDAVGEDGNT